MKKLAAAAFTTAILVLGMAASSDDVINWKELMNFLPETHAGLAMSTEPDGTTMSSDSYKLSSVDVDYGEDQQGHVSIMWGSMAKMQFETMQSMANLNIDSSDGYIRAIEIKGFPGVEEYDRDDNSASVMVALPNDIGVIIELENCEDTSQCVATAESMDLEGLAGL